MCKSLVEKRKAGQRWIALKMFFPDLNKERIGFIHFKTKKAVTKHNMKPESILYVIVMETEKFWYAI